MGEWRRESWFQKYGSGNFVQKQISSECCTVSALFPSVLYVNVSVCVSLYVYHLLPRFLWNANIQSLCQFRILGVMFLHNPTVIIYLSEWIPHTSLSLALDYTEHKNHKGVIKENSFFFSLPSWSTVNSASVYSVCDCVWGSLPRAARGHTEEKAHFARSCLRDSLLCLPLLVFPYFLCKITALGPK